MAQYIKGAAQGRVVMQLFIAVSALWWILYWFLQPILTGKAWLNKINSEVKSQFLGVKGSVFLLQALPVVVIVFLSYFIIELRRRTKPSMKSADKKPKVDWWTVPIIVRSPLGMLTLGDIAFILVTLFIVFWFFIKSSTNSAQAIDLKALKPGDKPKWAQKMHSIGELLGATSLITIALLWIPVSRGSPILNVIGVPFERAVKYHTWLGLLTVWLLIGHGVVLIAYFIKMHDIKELFSWHATGVAVIPGLVALAAGVLMMTTAFGRVRRMNFDLFFATHHLYLVFIVFFAFHAAGHFYYVMVPVLLFFLDRFMRMVQSRKAVDVLSAKVLRCGAMELKFAKPASATYHPLSFIYVRLPSVSLLEWHPFSVASSPLDGTNQIAIYIKPLGGFTKNVHDALIRSTKSNNEGREVFKCRFSFKVGVEGPYGDESAFYLRYKSLVMVAGGIGVTPFLALIRDVLHRYELRQEGLPSYIKLIFCVKNASELHILDTLALNSILPGYEEYLTLKVDAYVTRQVVEQENNTALDMTRLPMAQTNLTPIRTLKYNTSFHEANVDVLSSSSSSALAKAKIREISPIASSGHTRWVAATVAATFLGFFLVWGMFNDTVLNTHDSNYVQALLYIASVALGVVVFGGGMMLLWALSTKNDVNSDSKVMSQLSNSPSPAYGTILELEEKKDIESSGAVHVADDGSMWQENVTLGRRPNWTEIFRSLVTEKDGQDVGVMVSGGLQMQEDVAHECKHHSLSRASTAVFHYQSVSFEL